MNAEKRKNVSSGQKIGKDKMPPVYLVSGASGASGMQIIETVLAQFLNIRIPIIKMPHIRRKEQVRDIMSEASKNNGTVVHTMVDPALRNRLIRHGEKRGCTVHKFNLYRGQ